MTKKYITTLAIIFALVHFNSCQVYAGNSFFSQDSENKIYIIEEEVNLNGKTFSVPKDSVLLFKKQGCIKNGKVIFNETYLDGSVKFMNCRFSGKVANNTCKLSWFGLSTDKDAELSNKRKNSEIISEVLRCIGPVLEIDDFYPVSSTINISTHVTFRAADWKIDYVSSSYETDYVPKYGFYTTQSNGSLFFLNTNSDINLYGLYLKGTPEEFINAASVPDKLTYAFDSPYTRGSLHAVYNCLIEGFNYGVRSFGSYIEKIQNTTFNACQFGIYTIYTSDFDVYYCKFTNCMPNIKLSATQTLNSQTMSRLRQTAGGTFCEGCGMIDYAGNYFENNFINAIVDEGDVIINFSDNTFCQPVFTDIYIYNDGVGQDGPFMSLSAADLNKISIDNLAITKNKFIKNKNSQLNYILFIRDTNVLPYTTEKRDRGTNFVFSENIITDLRTSVLENDSIIGISCQNSKSSRITCFGNNFMNSKAKHGLQIISGSSGYITFITAENQIPDVMENAFVSGDESIVKLF